MPYKSVEKNRIYQRDRVRHLRAAWFAEHGPCVDCQTWDNLELDHVDARTKDPLLVGRGPTGIPKGTGALWTWSAARRAEELAKCVVRCEDCHAKKTAANKEQATVAAKPP